MWPAEQALHSSLTVFLALHTIATRWIYSFVPYDDWTNAVFGARLSEAFSWERNHFDRLVHFAYGVCLTAMWDAHADMALAALGALTTALVTSLASSARRRSPAATTR